MLYAIIMAGGSGTRLWPVSRSNKPKQLLPFLGEDTLLQKTFKRTSGFIDKDKIIITTGKGQPEAILKQLPGFDAKNISIEPSRRDTAPAFVLAAAMVEARDPRATIVNINSDAYVLDEKEYGKIIKLAEEMIADDPEYTLSVGIVPTYPETGYGYIKVGDKIKDINGHEVYQVDQFKEKPDQETAKKFMSSGKYLWNPTLFMWRVDKFMELVKTYQPAMYDNVKKIQKAIDTPGFEKVLEAEYNQIEPISIDYAIIEKVKKMMVIPGDFGWSDVGHWQAIKEILSKDEMDNLVQSKNFIGIDTKGSLIYSPKKKLVATIGLDNVVIVDTPEALLVCAKDRSQEVKQIVNKLKEDGKNEYL